MWLEAIITQEDLVQVMGEFLPVKIFLDPEETAEGVDRKKDSERSLMLHTATSVALVAEEGLRVTCPAELTWSVVGMSPTMKLDALRVLIRPRVVEKSKGHQLEIDLEVEEADFRVLPGFVDATIVKAVNAALAAKRPTWNFTETLTRTVGLGKTFDPVEALKIEVSWGKQRIGAEALTLVVSFKVGMIRND